MEKITDKIIKDIVSHSRESKIIPFSDIAEEARMLDDLDKEYEVFNDLIAGFDPAFQEYMHMVEFLTNFSEVILGHPEMRKHALLLSEAADRSLMIPEGATGLYFNLWMLFDAQIAPGTETLAALVLVAAERLGGINPRLRGLIIKALQSRMGFYILTDTRYGRLALKEILTNKTCMAICPSEYMGEPGDILFLRLFPAIEDGFPDVVVTTPFLIDKVQEQDVLLFFAKHGISDDTFIQEEELYNFLKQGPDRMYWLKYILEAFSFVNEEKEVIHLAGLPKI